MSTNHLDTVKTFDQFSYGQWKALGTKLGGVEAVKAILRGTSAVSVEVIRRLTDLSSAGIGGGKRSPHKFSWNRKGLYVWDGFSDNILAAASNKAVITKKVTLGYADLTQQADDAEVTAELPEGYIFEDVDVFLNHLAILVDTQKDGGPGWLLNNGHWNIFYVRVGSGVFTVDVLWGSGGSVWRCGARRLGDVRWRAGCRVFSATVAA